MKIDFRQFYLDWIKLSETPDLSFEDWLCMLYGSNTEPKVDEEMMDSIFSEFRPDRYYWMAGGDVIAARHEDKFYLYTPEGSNSDLINCGRVEVNQNYVAGCLQLSDIDTGFGHASIEQDVADGKFGVQKPADGMPAIFYKE